MNIRMQTQKRGVEKKQQYSWIFQIAVSVSVARCNTLGIDNHSVLCLDFFFTVFYKCSVGKMHYLIKDDIIIYLHFWILHNMIGVVQICMPARDSVPRDLEAIRRLVDFPCPELTGGFRPLDFSRW